MWPIYNAFLPRKSDRLSIHPPTIQPSNSNIQEPDSACCLHVWRGHQLDSTLAHRTELSRVSSQLQSGETAKKILGPTFPFEFGWNADRNFPSPWWISDFKYFGLLRSVKLKGCLVIPWCQICLVDSWPLDFDCIPSSWMNFLGCIFSKVARAVHLCNLIPANLATRLVWGNFSQDYLYITAGPHDHFPLPPVRVKMQERTSSAAPPLRIALPFLSKNCSIHNWLKLVPLT